MAKAPEEITRKRCGARNVIAAISNPFNQRGVCGHAAPILGEGGRAAAEAAQRAHRRELERGRSDDEPDLFEWRYRLGFVTVMLCRVCVLAAYQDARAAAARLRRTIEGAVTDLEEGR